MHIRGWKSWNCMQMLFRTNILVSYNSFKHWQCVWWKKFLQRAKQGLHGLENTRAYFWTSPSYSTKSSFFRFWIVLSLCHIHQIWKRHFMYSFSKAVQRNTILHIRNKSELCTLTFRILGKPAQCSCDWAKSVPPARTNLWPESDSGDIQFKIVTWSMSTQLRKIRNVCILTGCMTTWPLWEKFHWLSVCWRWIINHMGQTCGMEIYHKRVYILCMKYHL